MIHAVIDTNVLVSALLTSKSDTATVQVLEAIMNGQIIPLYNEEIIRTLGVRPQCHPSPMSPFVRA